MKKTLSHHAQPLSGQFRKLILLVAFGFLALAARSQTNPNEASWSGSGYYIKKVVSNLSIPSGVNFSYTIMFTAPAGVSSVSIQDQVPAGLTVVSIAPLSPVCGVMPVVTITGGSQVDYTLGPLPPTCSPSGSFTIVVKFPEGITCNGTTARNRAGIMVSGDYQWTPYISTAATAADPWKSSKSILAGAVVNPSGGSCGYLIPPDGTVTYRLSVLKDNPYFGNVIGQQNMSGAVVTDILPAGAVVVGTLPPGVSVSLPTLTWIPNSGNLNAANPYAYYFVDIQIKYPVGSFPNGSTINNQVTLTGTTCNQQVSHPSNQTCVQVGQVIINPNAYFQKYLALTNRVPGCTGYYNIVICNNGNVNLSPFKINDVIPSGITVDKIQVYGANATAPVTVKTNGGANTIATGITSGFFDSGPITGTTSDVEMHMTGSLAVNQCLNLLIYFTVGPNPTGTVITNCATFNPLANPLTLPQTCVSFTVKQGNPEPCLLKDICSPKSSYVPGDTLRFRLRVQNIGSATMTGAAVQDVLNSSFTYLGNEKYFVATTFNPPCSTPTSIPSGTTAWSGVSPSHSGNNLSWTLPPIASDCQLFYVSYCGYYGTWGLPYYYIDFDVVVNSFALPGVTPNKFSISGGNLPGTFNSNMVNILITASFGQEASKQVSIDNGATYLSTGTVAAGGTARFRLNYKNTSNVPVSSVNLVDLLGRDDGSNDWLILNRAVPRGSQFDLTYTAAGHATSLLPSASPPTPVINWATGNNICLVPFGISAGCSTVSWTTTIDRNIRLNYGSYVQAPATTLREDFNVGIPVNIATGLSACNDFAAIATADFLLNGNPTSVALTPIASPKICLTVGTVTSNCCDSVSVQQVQGDGCCARITTACKVKTIDISVSNGTFAFASWNCGTLPTGYIGQSSYTFPGNSCMMDLTTCFKPITSGIVTVSYVIHFDNGQTCEKKIELDCGTQHDNCCDSVSVWHAQGDPCCARIKATCKVKAVDVNVVNGVLSYVNWICGPVPTGYIGQSSFTFPASSCLLDMKTCVTANMPGGVTINYTVYFDNGEKCEKSIKLECKPSADCCASIDYKLKHKWPFIGTLVGTFNITNLNPSSPICYVDITPTPAGTFSTGSLIVDGVTSTASWIPTRIPASGNLSPAAVNSIKFNLTANNYNGVIYICVVKCDGTRCCFEFKWNTKPVVDVGISIDEKNITEKLVAISISPVVNNFIPNKIKYVSFGMADEAEIKEFDPQFYAISSSEYDGEENPKDIALNVLTYMGKYNAFFELKEAKKAEEFLGLFNMVIMNKLPQLGCTLFDEDGNLIFSGIIKVSGSTNVSTAVILEEKAGIQSGMFEFLNLYPNPADGHFKVSYATGSKRLVYIQMINSSGQVVYTLSPQNDLPGIHNLDIDAGSLPAGNYTVRLSSDGDILTRQVVIR